MIVGTRYPAKTLAEEVRNRYGSGLGIDGGTSVTPFCSFHDLPLYWLGSAFIVVGMAMLSAYLVRSWLRGVHRNMRKARRRRVARSGPRWVKVR